MKTYSLQANSSLILFVSQKYLGSFVTFQWFGYYVPGQAKKTQTLQESKLYTEVSCESFGNKTVSETSFLTVLGYPE